MEIFMRPSVFFSVLNKILYWNFYKTTCFSQNIKVFKLGRQNRYYSVKKQCILARRPLLDIRSVHVACVRKDVCESVCNYVESYFEISIEYNWYAIWFKLKIKKEFIIERLSETRVLFPIYLQTRFLNSPQT